MRSSAKIDELRERAGFFPLPSLAVLSGVSERTISSFRNGYTPGAGTMAKIARAVSAMKSGHALLALPGALPLDSGKAWEGRTTVKEITRGKRCGFCGQTHPDRFDCE